MAVANGTVEIKVRITDEGQAKAVRALNADLVEVDKAQVRAATSSKGMVAGYLGAQKGANDVKGKVDELLGIVSFAAPAVAALGGALAAAFSGAARADRTLEALRAFEGVIKATAAASSALASEVDRLADKALSAEAAVAVLTGDKLRADAIERRRALTAAERDVDDARQKISEITSRINWVGGARDQADLASRLFARLEAEREELAYRYTQTGQRIRLVTDAEKDAALERKRGTSAVEAYHAAASDAVQTSQTLADLTAQRARAEEAYASLMQTKSRPALEAQVKSAALVATSAESALKATSTYTSAMSSLLREQGAGRAAVAQAQKDEFEIKKTIGLIEAEAVKASLTGELSKLEAMREQYKLLSLMRGQSTADLSNVETAIGRIQGAVGAVDRYSAALSSATFRPGGGGQGGRGAGAGAFAFRASNDNDTFVRPGLAGSAAVEAEYAAKIADAERRRTDAVARRTDLLRMQAAAPARERGRFEEGLVTAGGDIAEQARTVVQLEAEKQAKLSELTRQGEAERAAARQAAQDEQIAGFARVVGSAVSAYDSMQGSAGVAADWFVNVARTAGAVAENWKDLVAGKSGAILAIGEVATAGIKNEKARAGTMVLVAVADGALAATRGDVAGVISAGIAATTYGIIAGSGGGSGATGRAPARAPSVRASASMGASQIIMNINAPWIGSNPQEVGAYLERQRAAVDGTGYRWAA